MKITMIKEIVRAKHQIWTYLGASSIGLKLLHIYCKYIQNKDIVVGSDTELVIEGYPRSANTYSVAVLYVSNGLAMRIGRHVHGSAQLVQGVKKGIPAVLLLRNPVDAVVSLLLRNPCLSAKTMFNNYVLFHSALVKYTKDIVVVAFKLAITSMDLVIEHVNCKYDTSFRVPNLDDSADEITKMVDYMDMQDRKSDVVDSMTVARPNSIRKQKSKDLKRVIYRGNENVIEDCFSLYNYFLKQSICDRE